MINRKTLPLFLLSLFILIFSSCARMGYGVLLWSIEEPAILSGTVLPVYIRSNINQTWVVGVPESHRRILQSANKIEVPFGRLEFIGRRGRAVRRANEFAQYAATYAETLQDRLPIRERPDNSARMIYRLRLGQIIKILERVDGAPPISASGEPFAGNWYRVLTEDGIIGFCFSLRLRFFDHHEGPLQTASLTRTDREPDPLLDMVMSRTWSPEFYQQMINSRRIIISQLERNFRFDPGFETGIARIIMPDIQMEFPYTDISPEGEGAWRFEGTNLNMSLRGNNTLAVQFLENTGLRRTLVFVALPTGIDALIDQENARRAARFMAIYNQGPIFTSNNFGTITFMENGTFTWTGFDLLVPQHLPAGINGEGRVYMNLFMAASIAEQHDGAFTMRFPGNINLSFLYNIDNQGIRLQVVPDFTIENSAVTRTTASPMVLFFFRDSPY